MESLDVPASSPPPLVTAKRPMPRLRETLGHPWGSPAGIRLHPGGVGVAENPGPGSQPRLYGRRLAARRGLQGVSRHLDWPRCHLHPRARVPVAFQPARAFHRRLHRQHLCHLEHRAHVVHDRIRLSHALAADSRTGAVEAIPPPPAAFAFSGRHRCGCRPRS